MSSELGQSLRAYRQRQAPDQVSETENRQRRVQGLRREEVAAEAGISVNYLTRLEQGRARNPSPSVVGALIRALKLNATEAEYVHNLAGFSDRVSPVASRCMTASVRRILARFDDVPMIVIDPAWTVVEANSMARTMLGEDIVGSNSARRQFLGPHVVQRDPADAGRFERDIVGDLRLQATRHPDDAEVCAVVAELAAASPRFAALWADPPSTGSASSRKTFTHPLVGSVTVDCDHLEIVGTDLRIVMWTAAPGTPDAAAMAALRCASSE